MTQVAHALVNTFAPYSNGTFQVIASSADKLDSVMAYNGCYLFVSVPQVAVAQEGGIKLRDHLQNAVLMRKFLGSWTPLDDSNATGRNIEAVQPLFTLYCNVWEWQLHDRTPKQAFLPGDILRFEGPCNDIVNDRNEYTLREARYQESWIRPLSAAVDGNQLRRVRLHDLIDAATVNGDGVQDQIFVQNRQGFFDRLVESIRQEYLDEQQREFERLETAQRDNRKRKRSDSDG